MKHRYWWRPLVMHVRLWRSCFAQAIRRDLQFRSQTILNAFSSTLDLILGVVPVLVLTDSSATASGWTGSLAVVVVGAYGVCTGLMDCFIAPNLTRIDAYVRRGDLDLILIRPVNAPLYSALRWMEPAELGRVLTGLALMIAAAHTAGLAPDPAVLLVSAAWASIGVAGFSLLWANLAYLAFWVESAEPINEVAVQVREAGKYPLTYFPKPVQLLLRTLVPAGLVAAVPVEALTSPTDGLWVAALSLAAALAFTALHWRVANRRYSSASS
jgi:ABC-2 type transport system permease protein